IIDANGTDLGSNVVYTDFLDSKRWRSDFFNSGRDECARYLCCYNSIPNASAVLVRRDALLSTDHSYEEMRLAGDWMKWVEILLSYDLAFIATPLNRYRQHAFTVRKTTAIATMLDEMSLIRCFIADALQGEPSVESRIVDSILRDWLYSEPYIADTDTFTWF